MKQRAAAPFFLLLTGCVHHYEYNPRPLCVEKAIDWARILSSAIGTFAAIVLGMAVLLVVMRARERRKRRRKW